MSFSFICHQFDDVYMWHKVDDIQMCLTFDGFDVHMSEHIWYKVDEL